MYVPKRFMLSPGMERFIILLVLLIAAALRILDLTRLPNGYNDEEITTLYFSALAREGEVASFYRLPNEEAGREGLYPLLTALGVNVLGTGRLPYRVIPFAAGLLSIALAYALGRRLFGGTAGIIAALALAVNHWHIILSRTATRESLILPLFLGILILTARAFHLRQQITPAAPLTATYAALGILLGVAIYVHWIALLFPFLVVIYAFYLIVTRQPISRRSSGYVIFAFVVGVIVAIPYMASALRATAQSAAHTWWLIRPESVGDFFRSAYSALISIGTLGDPNPARNVPGEGLVRITGVILFIFGVGAALRIRRNAATALASLALVVGMFPDMWSHGAPNFAHSTGGLAGIVLLMGYGGAALLNWLTYRARVGYAFAALLFLSSVGVYLSGRELYLWGERPDVNAAYRGGLGALATYIDYTTPERSTTVCSFTLGDPSLNAIEPLTYDLFTRDSTLLPLMVNRRNAALRFSNCLTAVALTDGGGQQTIAFADPKAPAQLAPAVTEWLANAQTIPVRSAPGGGVLHIDARQIVADTFGQTTQSIISYAPETAGGEFVLAPLPLRMGGYLTFQGYRLSPPPYRPGSTLTITTYWRADGEQVLGLRFFAHVLRNPFTEPVLQNDLFDVDPSLLRDRDVFLQVITIPLPADFPLGDYWLSIGAYSALDDSRVVVYDGETVRGSRLFLNKITVAP